MVKELSKGVRLNCIKSNKFKDICISINFISENHQKSATQRSLLSMMLVDRSNLYNTKQKMNQICDHLYGCTLGSRVVSYGKGHCVELRSKIINPIYIHENHNIINDWLNFINEIIFNPCLQQNVFEENQTILESRIRRKEDDAQSYTISKVFEYVLPNEPLSIHVKGTIDYLNKCNLEDIKETYEQLIKHDRVEIVICGDFDENQMFKMISSKLKFNDRNSNLELNYLIESKEKGIKTEDKVQPQTNIAMMFATNTDIFDSKYPALKVANAMFGQLPSSFLFRVVREEYSLCYSISSHLISYDGGCLVTTGIEKENVDKTIELILEQLEKCQKGEFDDELLETTKMMLVNALKNSLDEMSSILGYAFTNSLLNRNYPIEKNIEDVMNVTKKDCIEIFNRMKYLGTYVCQTKEIDYE